MNRMKNIKHSMHIMLTFASALAFLGGWATLAHSRKPVQATSTISGQSVEALPALAPLTPINISGAASDNGSGNMTIIAPPLQSRSPRAVFSTGGS
jgi:hypothetical protein